MGLKCFYILLLLFMSSNATTCPSRCLCFRTTVRCMFLHLDKIPQVPPETTILDLRVNAIRDIIPNSFKDLKHLNTLLLNNNQITSIVEGAFNGLKELKYLYLYKNKIRKLHGRAFRGLNKLEQLYIHFNELEELEQETFSNLPSLERLFLHNNKLTRIPPGTFSNSLALRRLRLDSNALVCDCKMMWLAEMLKEKLHTQAAATCESPVSLQGKSLASIKKDEFRCQKPSFIEQPNDVEVSFGSTAYFTCKVDGDPEPEVIWLHNNNEIFPTRDHRYSVLSDGTLMIQETTDSDKGVYECMAKNIAGEVKAIPAHLRYYDTDTLPRFNDHVQEQQVMEGRRVDLHCDPSGFPDPQISWGKDGGVLPQTGRHFVISKGRILRISQVTPSDQGIYVCQAYNKAGTTEHKITLIVKPKTPPTFSRVPTDLQVNLGESVEIPCSANGDPEPIISWVKDGITVEEDHNRMYSSGGQGGGSLFIFNASKSDAGRYICSATNSIDSVASSMVLTITDKLSKYAGDPFVRQSINEATEHVDKALNATVKKLYDGHRPTTPSEFLAILRFPTQEAREVARAAEIYEQTLQNIYRHVDAGMMFNLTEFYHQDLVSPANLQLIAKLAGCESKKIINNCLDLGFHHKYRTYDGTCNNLQNPVWGASLTPFKRLIKSAYENGFNLPIGWNSSRLYYGFPKPTARLISSTLISTETVSPDSELTHMVMQWGQFLDHDLDLAINAISHEHFSDGIPCTNSCKKDHPCFPIEIPANDTRSRHNHNCMEFLRSSAICGSGSTSVFFNTVMPREQINQVTSFIDASMVYGNSEKEALLLRDLNSLGLMKMGITMAQGKQLLPPNENAPMDCQQDPSVRHIGCFLAGDIRANEQLGLLTMHTIWVREHNRIAKELPKINPQWDGETIYQEARKILAAEIQHITYQHWLPKILGVRGMNLIGLYRGYDPSINPSIANAFATAALRFGHTMINPILQRLDNEFRQIPQGHLPLHKAFFAPQRLVEEGGVDPLLRGLFAVPAKKLKPDEFLNSELTERLFELARTVSLDLAALNIQRGRDHGIPGYLEFRKFCNLSSAETFSELRNEIRDVTLRNKLQKIYGHPGNIDLFVGGISETPLDGARIGPTFVCILAYQFKNVREGDRFWYENPGVFRSEQLAEIKRTSLARIVCDSGDNIQMVQRDVFLIAHREEEWLPCHRIPRIDLNVWREETNLPPPTEESIKYIGDPFVQQSINEAIEHVNNAVEGTVKRLYDGHKPTTSSEFLALFRFPNPEAREVARSAEIYEQTLENIRKHVEGGMKFNLTDFNYKDLISPENLKLIAEVSGCGTHRKFVNCSDMCFHQKYRSYDGTCNNLQHTTWGASLTHFKRLLKPAYENGFNTPIGWNQSHLYFGFPKPSARYISYNLVKADSITADLEITHMVMQWGQFLDHDLDLAINAISHERFSDGVDCRNSCDNQPPCFPIRVPDSDPRILESRCMEFVRSSALCGSGSTSVFFKNVLPREQINDVTSFIDASNVYGSSEKTSLSLRDVRGNRGLLKIGIVMASGKPLMPPNQNSPMDCQQDPRVRHIGCFLAGDIRANEQLGLLAMHTLWIREHNRIVLELQRINPHWDGDMLYHEARKIVGAMMQHITYKHWLPKILGKKGLELIDEYKVYDPNVDPSVANSFATAALRFGHTLINPILHRLNNSFHPIPQGHLPLHKAFFSPQRLVEEGGIDPILRGLFAVAAKKLKPDQLLNSELTERLFELARSIALDLAALNIQRGRDHGLPPYNEFRKLCNLTVSDNFDDLRGEIQDSTLRAKLQRIYGHPGNIDLFVGGISETPIEGAKMGPTFMCLLTDQFKRVRDGDRFWYENPGVFKPEQLTQIKQASLARVLCDSGDNIDKVQKDVFFMVNNTKDYLLCDKIPKVDLTVWTECCQECSKSGDFNSLSRHLRIRRSSDYSYPEDKPSFSQSSSSVSNVTESRMSFRWDDPSDIVEERIEGMEAMVEQLKKTMKQLSRKVNRLEARLNKKKQSCLDSKGKERTNGEDWYPDDCTKCFCKDSQVLCRVDICPEPNCTHPKYESGKCCPTC